MRKTAIVLVLCMPALWLSPRVGARDLECGQSIVTSVKLRRDLGPCRSHGLVIALDNVVLDLNGHRIFGSTSSGDGAGVLLRRTFGSTVKNGTLTGFDAGIVVDRGGGNEVKRIKAFANIGDGSAFGDGILVNGSSNNLVKNNEVYRNGPFSGISIFAPRSDPTDPESPRLRADGNKIVANSVHDNNLAMNESEVDDAGIRLEAGTTRTTVKRNRIAFNGLDGIVVFGASTQNLVSGNRVVANGHHDRPHRLGDGIRVLGSSTPGNNRFEDNILKKNAGNGIVLTDGALGNLIKKNVATGNGTAGFSAPSISCLDNTWRRNAGSAFEPSCTRGR